MTCFMVSDDIEVVTCREGKGHRLRMTSVHASYALRELPAGDPRLAALAPHGTRVTLRLRDSIDLTKRSIEEIVRHWIILPECPVEFVEGARPPLRVGFDSPASALRHFSVPTGDDSKFETLVKSRSETRDLDGASTTASYELAFVVTTTFHPEHAFASAPKDPIPMVCIEGIRVADSLPGFEDRPRGLATLLSVRGSKRFRTTVSRSGLERDDEYEHVSEICLQLLFDHIRDEVDRIVATPGSPLSQASSASRLLRNQLLANSRSSIRKCGLEMFEGLPSIVVEKPEDPPRTMLRWKDVKALPEFWTLEARLLDFLGTISRDIGQELSLHEFISRLAPRLTRHFEYWPIVLDADLFGFNFDNTHLSQSVEFSRQHQFSAVRWIAGNNRSHCMTVDLENLCAADVFDDVRRKYNRMPYDLKGSSEVRRLAAFIAPIVGDSDTIQTVHTSTGFMMSPDSRLAERWSRLRNEIIGAASSGQNHERIVDLYLIASAIVDLIGEAGAANSSTRRNMWRQVWAYTPDFLRRSLDLPMESADIVNPETIFSARTYWRDWRNLD